MLSCPPRVSGAAKHLAGWSSRRASTFSALTRDQRGFGLVETTVVVAIAGLAIVGFLNAAVVQSIATRNIDANNIAMQIVRTYFEGIKQAGYNQEDYGTSCTRAEVCTFEPEPGYTMKISWDYINPDGTPTAGGADNKLKRVTIVELTRGGKQFLSNITTYKACLSSAPC